MSPSSSYTYYSDKNYGRSYDDIDHDWGRVFRLLFMSGLATLAYIGNIFTISAIIGDDLLRKKGNSFLASVTLADLLISALVLPASFVAILGQMEDSENICRLQYGICTMSCLTAAMFTAAIGVENFLRLKSLCHSEKNRERQLREQELRRSQSQQQQSQSAHSHASPYHSLHQHHGHHSRHHHQHNYTGSASSPLLHHTYHNSTGHATTSFTVHPNHNQNQAHSSSLPRWPSPTPAPLPPPPPESTKLICSVFQITLLNLNMWFVSGVIVVTHFIFLPQLMYSICGKSTQGATSINIGDIKIPKLPTPINQQLLLESITVLGICLISLICLGGLGFLKCAFIIRGWKKPKPYLTSREFALVASNCWNCLLRFLIWVPSIITVIMIQFGRSIDEGQRSLPLAYDYTGGITRRSLSSIVDENGFSLGLSSQLALALSEDSSSETAAAATSAGASASTTTTIFTLNNEYSFLHRILICPMILPSCLHRLINIVTNRDFRRCYVQLFHYCCCKTSVALSGRPRESTRSGGDVRVHIIPGYNMYSAHSETASAPQPRFATFKFGAHSRSAASSGGGKRDVYEL